jgi:hypothetical protein
MYNRHSDNGTKLYSRSHITTSLVLDQKFHSHIDITYEPEAKTRDLTMSSKKSNDITK